MGQGYVEGFNYRIGMSHLRTLTFHETRTETGAPITEPNFGLKDTILREWNTKSQVFAGTPW